jgi:formylglycine-generating enzyme required for sulfatase activity
VSRKPGEEFTLQAGELEMKFAWVPPGSFHMGGKKYKDEKPIHHVTITQGFYLGIVPVTQAQWQAVTADTPSHFRGNGRPVETVSWHDGQTFCAKLAALTGKPIRLPTEAEWEYACRADKATNYSSGNGKSALKKVGWFCENSGGKTQSVGKLEPNGWGLFDMHGNVWEWCADGKRIYPEESQTDPVGPSGALDARVLRGGSSGDNPDYCRAAFRLSYAPSARYDFCGLRVCFHLD